MSYSSLIFSCCSFFRNLKLNITSIIGLIFNHFFQIVYYLLSPFYFCSGFSVSYLCFFYLLSLYSLSKCNRSSFSVSHSRYLVSPPVCCLFVFSGNVFVLTWEMYFDESLLSYNLSALISNLHVLYISRLIFLPFLLPFM